MNISLKKILNYSLVMLVIASLTSCVKKDFDTPPTGGEDPVMTGTRTTIAALKALYTGTPVKITSDLYIVGSVIADDESGNFYKEMVLQDSTAGISIILDQSSFYTTYKIGRRVFVKCNNLYLGEYNGIVQLGASVASDGSLNRIPSALIPEFLLPGSYYHYVTPKNVDISQLTPTNIGSYLNTLISIDSIQFQNLDTTFADGVNKTDINLTLVNCNSEQIIIRSSGYSNFATTKVPTGSGFIVAVMQIYNSFGTPAVSDLQLKVRALTDLSMTSSRCGSIGPCNIDTSGTYVSLASIRCLFSQGFSGGLTGKKIRGVVVSDKNNGNITTNNLALQDQTGGIVVRFAAANTFNVGDSVEIAVGGVSLTEFSGLLEFDATPLTNVTVLATGMTPTVRTATVDEINTNFELWESTLVKVVNATITGAQPYNGTKSVSDGTGSIDLYTRSGASFSGLNFPTGTVSVTGILAPFGTTKQLTMRSATDVQ